MRGPWSNGSVTDRSRPRAAYPTAIRLLARRDLSVAQLKTRLLERELDRDEVDQAIERLVAERWLDDDRMAEAQARRLIGVKHRGARRARQEIEGLGIASETADRAVRAVLDELDEADVLEKAIAKRLPGPIRDRAHFRRLYQALLRQGFAPDQVARALVARAGGHLSFVEE